MHFSSYKNMDYIVVNPVITELLLSLHMQCRLDNILSALSIFTENMWTLLSWLNQNQECDWSES